MRVRITTDSPADLPREICETYGFKTVPLHVILGDDCFEDGINVTTDDIYNFYAQNKLLPKTSAVSIEEYNEFFRKMTQGGEPLVHFSLSSGISSSCQNAKIASENFDNVYIVDTKSLSTGIALAMLKAYKMSAMGMSAEEIAAKSEETVKNISTTFIISNLEFLHKGGRCSGVASFGANILGIKPSISANEEGRLVVDKKYRGKFEDCISRYIDDLIEANKNGIDTDIAVIVSTDGVSPEQINASKRQILKQIPFKEVVTAKAGCTITSHCGKGTFSFMFLKNG